MKTYLYPQNLQAPAKLWLWGLRDFVILAIAVLLSVVAAVTAGTVLPLALTLCWAFLTIRPEETTIMDFFELGRPVLSDSAADILVEVIF